jgi:TonB family protein
MSELLLLLESAAVVLLAWVVTSCMRRRSAAERHVVWLAAFVALLLLPIGRLLPSMVAPDPLLHAVVRVSSRSGVSSAVARDWLSDLWLLGAVLCFIRVIVGLLRGLFLLKEAEQIRTAESYAVRYSRELRGPAAWGLGRKMMLLPVSAARWQDERRALVLRHEAAHLRRNDCWALLVAEVACAIFWCNPLVWFAASRLRLEQEHAADDEVLRTGSDPADYAGHLVALAKAGRPPILAAGAISQSQLTARVEAILDSRRLRRMPTRTMIVATVLALLVIAFPLASMQVDRKVEKVGGDVKPPKVLHKEEPKYTEEARDARIEGGVQVSAIIEANGRIYDAKVVKGLDPGLDQNALAAVRTWIFRPAEKAGQPVAVSATIEVNFRLF